MDELVYIFYYIPIHSILFEINPLLIQGEQPFSIIVIRLTCQDN